MEEPVSDSILRAHIRKICVVLCWWRHHVSAVSQRSAWHVQLHLKYASISAGPQMTINADFCRSYGSCLVDHGTWNVIVHWQPAWKLADTTICQGVVFKHVSMTAVWRNGVHDMQRARTRLMRLSVRRARQVARLPWCRALPCNLQHCRCCTSLFQVRHVSGQSTSSCIPEFQFAHSIQHVSPAEPCLSNWWLDHVFAKFRLLCLTVSQLQPWVMQAELFTSLRTWMQCKEFWFHLNVPVSCEDWFIPVIVDTGNLGVNHSWVWVYQPQTVMPILMGWAWFWSSCHINASSQALPCHHKLACTIG